MRTEHILRAVNHRPKNMEIVSRPRVTVASQPSPKYESTQIKRYSVFGGEFDSERERGCLINRVHIASVGVHLHFPVGIRSSTLTEYTNERAHGAG